MLENQLEGMEIKSHVSMVIKFPTPGILQAMAMTRRMLRKSMVEISAFQDRNKYLACLSVVSLHYI